MRFRNSCLGAILVISISPARAQTLIDLRVQSKNVDFSGAPSTKPVKTGAVLPSACGVGEMFYLTDAPSGQNLHTCTSVNSWTMVGSASLAAGSGIAMAGATLLVDDAIIPQYITGTTPPTMSCFTGRDYYLDTVSGAVYYCRSADTWQKLYQPGQTFSTTDIASGIFALPRGGTNQSSWTPGRCVQVSGDGTRLESATGACGTGSASGDVSGPVSSTDKVIPRFSGSTGKLLQVSGVSIDDTNGITAPGGVTTGDAAAAEGEMRLSEQAGTDFIGLKAPASRATSLTVRLPAGDPANGQTLRFGALVAGESTAAFSDVPGTGACPVGQFVTGLNHNTAPTCDVAVGGGAGGGGGAPNTEHVFTNQTGPLVLTHNLGSRKVIWECHRNTGSGYERLVVPGFIAASSPYNVTVDLGTTAITGYCVVNGFGSAKYAQSFSVAGASLIVSAAAHGIPDPDFGVVVKDSSGRVLIADWSVNAATRDVTVNFGGATVSGRIILQ